MCDSCQSRFLIELDCKKENRQPKTEKRFVVDFDKNNHKWILELRTERFGGNIPIGICYVNTFYAYSFDYYQSLIKFMDEATQDVEWILT
jgi:hypothetical protein